MPFSSELVLDRSDDLWLSALEHPYYIYPVHVSLSFLYSTTLASALYLVLLRYLNRQYSAVVQLIDTVRWGAGLGTPARGGGVDEGEQLIQEGGGGTEVEQSGQEVGVQAMAETGWGGWFWTT